MGMQKNPQTTQSLKIHKAKTDRAEKQNRQIYSYGGDFNTPLSVTDWNAQQKISKGVELNNSTD